MSGDEINRDDAIEWLNQLDGQRARAVLSVEARDGAGAVLEAGGRLMLERIRRQRIEPGRYRIGDVELDLDAPGPATRFELRRGEVLVMELAGNIVITISRDREQDAM